MCWLHHTTKFSFHYAFPMSSYLRVETLWTIKSSQTCKVAVHLKVSREHFHLFCFFSYFISAVLLVFIIHFLLYPLLNLGSLVIKKPMLMKMEVTDLREWWTETQWCGTCAFLQERCGALLRPGDAWCPRWAMLFLTRRMRALSKFTLQEFSWFLKPR